MTNVFGFQDPSSIEMDNLLLFHDYLLIFISTLSLIVLFSLVTIVFSDSVNNYLFEKDIIESIWTIGPVISLIIMGGFSLFLLFENEEDNAGFDFSVKAIGRQWYWSYDYPNGLQFDSYIQPWEDFNKNNEGFRLLETDHHVVIPVDSHIRMVTTSSDVLHSWTIPTMGVKADSTPGRLTVMYFTPKLVGLFYGQCSELCGVNHAFMPISLEVVPPKKFFMWLESTGQ